MKRRGFLKALGGAIGTAMLPVGSVVARLLRERGQARAFSDDTLPYGISYWLSPKPTIYAQNSLLFCGKEGMWELNGNQEPTQISGALP